MIAVQEIEYASEGYGVSHFSRMKMREVSSFAEAEDYAKASIGRNTHCEGWCEDVTASWIGAVEVHGFGIFRIADDGGIYFYEERK